MGVCIFLLNRAPPARDSRPPPGVPIAANPNAEPLAPRRGGGGSGLAGVLALAGGYVAPPPNMVQVSVILHMGSLDKVAFYSLLCRDR